MTEAHQLRMFNLKTANDGMSITTRTIVFLSGDSRLLAKDLVRIYSPFLVLSTRA
jgi:hypothetical protein